MIVIAYLKRDGRDKFRMYREFNDNAKAKSFISYCLEKNRESKDKNSRRFENIRIFVGCKLISANDLMNI